MIQKKLLIENLYGFCPNDFTVEKLNLWQKLFVEYNAKVNLTSKNDIPLLFEKHVLDSLSLVLTGLIKDGVKLLDIGTGGGFPSVIISIFFPQVQVFALDSINKKINFIKILKNELELSNLECIISRAEECPPLHVDILTSRAVGKISDVWQNSRKHLKYGGHFVSFKAKTAETEASFAEKKWIELKEKKIIPYQLPFNDDLTRKLVVFKKMPCR